MGALCPTGKNEVVVTNRGVREVDNERKEEEEATSTTRIPDKETSSSKKVDKVSSREKALRELRHKQYVDVVSRFNRETLDVSKQLQNYDESEEDFLTSKYADILENVRVNLDIFHDVKIDEQSSSTFEEEVKSSTIKITTGNAVVPFLSVRPSST